MLSQFLAERMLRLVTSDERAEAIVGDLVEAQPEHFELRPRLRFWREVFAVLIAQGWRWTLAFVLTLKVGELLFTALNYRIYGLPFDSPERIPLYWGPYMTGFTTFTVFLSTIGLAALIRYGWTDRFARTAFFAGAWCVMSIGLMRPWFGAGLAISFAGFAFMMLSAKSRRMGFRVCLLAAGCSLVTFVAGWCLITSFGLWAGHTNIATQEGSRNSLRSLMMQIALGANLLTLGIVANQHHRLTTVAEG